MSRGGCSRQCSAGLASRRLSVAVCVAMLSMPSGFLRGQDTNEIPPLLPAYPEFPPTYWEQHSQQIVWAAVVLCVMAGMWVWWKLRPKPVIVLPPAVRARRALEQLREARDDARLSGISQVLRHYFCEVFNLRSGELTTAEFSQAVSQSRRIPSSLGSQVVKFLESCDQMKFSPAHDPSASDALSDALQLIEAAEAHQASLQTVSSENLPAKSQS